MRPFAVLTTLLASLALLVPTALHAQDADAFAGRWESTRETPRGETTWTLTLTRGEDGLTGSLGLMQREVPVTDVKLDGNSLTFTLALPMGGPRGGAGQRGGDGAGAMTQTFTGSLEDGEIRGEMTGPRGAMPMVWKRVQG